MGLQGLVLYLVVAVAKQLPQPSRSFELTREDSPAESAIGAAKIFFIFGYHNYNNNQTITTNNYDV